MKKRHIFIISSVLASILFITSCEQITSFFNPFVGKWKSDLFTLTLNPDKTFELETGIGITVESDGTYEYDEENLMLNFSEDHKTDFTYKFNEDKSELSLSPKTESRWFKATIIFEKQKFNE